MTNSVRFAMAALGTAADGLLHDVGVNVTTDQVWTQGAETVAIHDLGRADFDALAGRLGAETKCHGPGTRKAFWSADGEFAGFRVQLYTVEAPTAQVLAPEEPEPAGVPS